MSSLILPWPARCPALIDDAGTPVPISLPLVLLVDPDATRAGHLGMLLSRPTQHLSGELVAVLIALAAHVPQFVLLVHDPPTFDAVTLCETLRAASDVPIIILMMTPASADRTRALRAGADDAFPFPIAPAELHARIAAVLRRCRRGMPDRLHHGAVSE